VVIPSPSTVVIDLEGDHQFAPLCEEVGHVAFCVVFRAATEHGEFE
jgi:hypothetical protein